MSVTYHISSSNNDIDKIVDSFATKVINAIYQVVLLTSKFAGLIGLLLLSIILILIVPIVYLYLRQVNIMVKKKLRIVYNWINEANESELRYVHLEIERKNKNIRSILAKKKILDRNILTMGISNQANLLISQFINLEDSLKNAAYPNQIDQLSDEDIKELLSVFEGACID